MRQRREMAPDAGWAGDRWAPVGQACLLLALPRIRCISPAKESQNMQVNSIFYNVPILHDKACIPSRSHRRQGELDPGKQHLIPINRRPMME